MNDNPYKAPERTFDESLPSSRRVRSGLLVLLFAVVCLVIYRVGFMRIRPFVKPIPVPVNSPQKL